MKEKIDIIKKQEYNATSIDILEGIPHVRKRPGMYIGGTGIKGLHHLIEEIIDNAVDEITNGYGKEVKAILNADESITIIDDGRGIPIDIHPIKKIPAVRLVFEVPGAGGKFNNDAYKTSGGLHGVGASVVNALSSKVLIEIKRDGYLYTLGYENQKVSIPLTKGEKTKETGTKVTFYPDKEIFPVTTFSPEIIVDRLRELSFLNKGIKFSFTNMKNGKSKEFLSKNGIVDFVDYINGDREVIGKSFCFSGVGENDVIVDLAMEYTNSYSDSIYSFVNNIKAQGGTHIEGFRLGIKDAIDKFIKDSNSKAWQKNKLQINDILEGIIAIISVKLKNPEYDGQTKEALGNPEIKDIVKNIVANGFYSYLKDNKANAKKILDKICLAAEARENAKKARELTRKKNETNKDNEPIPKLAVALDKNPENCEIWICEGDSAGGNMKIARLRRTQAVLPLRGKILNCEDENLSKILDNKEIKSLIKAFGTGILDDFDIKKCNYGKIIIATDADIDGLHIQLLLLVLIYRYMKPLIENGYVYIALSPLYKITHKGKNEYIYFEKDLENAKKKYGNANLKIQRYKGLGEFQAQELFETTMQPETRKLYKVVISDDIAADRLLSITMGNKPENKRIYLEDKMEDEL